MDLERRRVRVTKEAIYLAAPWTARDQAKVFGERLQTLGFRITEPWWDHRDVGVYPNEAQEEDLVELQSQADLDIIGVESADVMVVLQYGKSEGKSFEQGLAYIMGHPVIVVSPNGDRGSLFQYMDHYTFVDSEDAAVEVLNNGDFAR